MLLPTNTLLEGGDEITTTFQIRFLVLHKVACKVSLSSSCILQTTGAYVAYTPVVTLTVPAEGEHILTVVDSMTSITGTNCDDPVNFATMGDAILFDFLLRQCVAEFSFDSLVSLFLK